jgi:hypothetical protein
MISLWWLAICLVMTKILNDFDVSIRLSNLFLYKEGSILLCNKVRGEKL